jgi:hypothetical protein
MKIIAILLFSILFVGCSSEGVSVLEESESHTTQKSHYLVGNWRADAEDAGVEILLSFNEDGTYSQDMAGQKQSGTWEKIDEDRVKVSTEHLANGQTWKLVEKGNGEMKVVFASGDSEDYSGQPILFKAN